jgi:hypothetical protein
MATRFTVEFCPSRLSTPTSTMALPPWPRWARLVPVQSVLHEDCAPARCATPVSLLSRGSVRPRNSSAPSSLIELTSFAETTAFLASAFRLSTSFARQKYASASRTRAISTRVGGCIVVDHASGQTCATLRAKEQCKRLCRDVGRRAGVPSREREGLHVALARLLQPSCNVSADDPLRRCWAHKSSAAWVPKGGLPQSKRRISNPLSFIPT